MHRASCLQRIINFSFKAPAEHRNTSAKHESTIALHIGVLWRLLMAAHGASSGLLCKLASGLRSIVPWPGSKAVDTPQSPDVEHGRDMPSKQGIIEQASKRPRLVVDAQVYYAASDPCIVESAQQQLDGVPYALPHGPCTNSVVQPAEDQQAQQQQVKGHGGADLSCENSRMAMLSDDLRLPDQQAGPLLHVAYPDSADVSTPRAAFSADASNDQPYTWSETIRQEAETFSQYIGSYSVQNCRQYQEDRAAFILFDGSIHMGMYDGHAGQNTSSYLQEHLLRTVSHRLQGGMTCPEALEEAFLSTNNDLRNMRCSYFSGSTATVVIVDGRQVICANAGDSPAFIVSKSGVATCLTVDHNPNTNESERLRVEAAGGRIEKMAWGERHKRVLSYDNTSGLAMTRAFGDFNFTGVVCDPHICGSHIGEDAMYLVLASDGLTERWTIQEAAAAVHELASHGFSPVDIATKLSNRAIDKGSKDNITVIVLDLQLYLKVQDGSQGWQQADGVSANKACGGSSS